MVRKTNKKTKTFERKAGKDLIAMRAHRLVHNAFDIPIEKGDDISELNLPPYLLAALKTEGVIK